jgi:hypothetical protein
MLSNLQKDVIRNLVKNRDANSYHAGGSVFNVNGQRISGDLDIFHPSSETCEISFRRDMVTLKEAGFIVEVICDTGYAMLECSKNAGVRSKREARMPAVA